MPAGQSQKTSSTSTTSVAAPTSVNPGVQSIYNSIFGGGAAGGAINTLQGIQSGQTLQNNVSQLYNTLQKSGQSQYQQGIASIKAAGGASGTRFSTDTSAQIGNYANQFSQNLSQTSTQMGLAEESQQAGAATPILSLLAQGANQYYTPKTTQTGTQTTQTQQTGAGAWINAGLGIAGGAVGVLSGLGDLNTGAGLASGIADIFR
jgi:hypothetical protein